MLLTLGRASGHKNYASLTLMKKECYEEEVQPYQKTIYIYIYIGL